MAVGDEITKSFASDGATYSLGLQARTVGATSVEGLASWVTEKKPPAKPSAHRASVTGADTADISSDTSYLDVGNSSQVAAFADSTVASSTATFFLALYDASDDLIGVTDEYQFQFSATYRDGAAGPYVSPRYIFDICGASRVKAFCSAVTGTPTVNLFLIAL